MTTEEKAKAYDEALERARKELKQDLHESGIWAIQRIFPELRESEDERIRKELIEFIKSLLCNDAFDRYKLGIWIAWLEKQKINTEGDFARGYDCGYEACLNSHGAEWLEKQKDINCLACDQHLKGYLAGRKVTEEEKQKENPKSADSIPADCVSDAKCEDRSPKHSDSDWTDIRDTPAYWRGWDDAMKQKEQKHPNGCFTCDEYKKGYEEGRRNGFTAGYNKAMKEVEQKEQKPASDIEDAAYNYANNFSQYDDTIYSEIVDAYKAGAYYMELKQKEQKPTWSEEDEKMLNDILGILHSTEDAALANFSEQKKWLKSFCDRPKTSCNWKPTEEQMEAFKEYIEDFQAKSEAAVGGWNNFDVMIRLYEQLKAIKEDKK